MVRITAGAWAVGLLLALGACGTVDRGGAVEEGTVEAGRISAEQALARVEAAIVRLPEVVDLERRMAEGGRRLVILLEGDADPGQDSPETWQVYVGERGPEHQVRLWAFNVDARTGAVSVTDPLTLVDLPFDLWRQRLAANPP